MSYECHITLMVADSTAATPIAKEAGWKTSKIDGDPLLGDRVFFYLTAHSASYHMLYTKMERTVSLLNRQGIAVVREKIEHILHDIRFPHDAKETAHATK